MNIFACDEDPVLAASFAPDKYVVKMPLESAQMLCTVAVSMGMEVPYRPTHRNHPCTLWVGASASNAEWLIQHGIALCQEYTRRYNKTHACQEIINGVHPLLQRLPQKGRTPFAQAMPDIYKRANPVDAYRAYMIGEKSKFAAWKPPASRPAWWTT